jgi:predicted unusual protein kinase regulating ubiquinone biosynthesis (AarF/ABC1/UbiB family)
MFWKYLQIIYLLYLLKYYPEDEERIKKTIQNIGIIFIKFCQWISNFESLTQFRFLKEFQVNCHYLYPLTSKDPFLQHISNIQYYCSGSVGNIYTGFYHNKKIIIKSRHSWIEQEYKDLRQCLFVFCYFLKQFKNIDVELKDFDIIIQSQFNFINEYKNIELFQQIYNKEKTILNIPTVYYATHELLIMEYIETKKNLNKYEKMEKDMLMKSWIFDQILTHNILHGDLHNGNWGYTDNGVVLFDYGFVFKNMELNSTFYINVLKNNYQNIEDSIFTLLNINKTEEIQIELNQLIQKYENLTNMSFIQDLLQLIKKHTTIVINIKLLFLINLIVCFNYLNQNPNIQQKKIFFENSYILCHYKNILYQYQKTVFNFLL